MSATADGGGPRGAPGGVRRAGAAGRVGGALHGCASRGARRAGTPGGVRRPRKVTILAIGSRGDVEPHVALGLALAAAGHEVTIGTHPEFEEFVTGRSLAFSAFDLSVKEIMDSSIGREMVESGQTPVRTTRRLLQIARPLFGVLLRDCMRICERTQAEAVVYSTLGSFCGGPTAAELLGIPAIASHLQPPNRMMPFMSVPFTPVDVLRRLYEWGTIAITERVMWRKLRPQLDAWRQELGLAPSERLSPLGGTHPDNGSIFYGYSPSIVQRPPAWGPNIHVTGYWFLPPEPEWRPPADLAAFLDDGPAPVFVSFGSMTATDPAALTGMVVEALEATKVRGVIGEGWAGLGRTALPDGIIAVDGMPYTWLFPRMAAVVHHGGAGTTAAALRAGVPAVVVPCIVDQFFWGRTVHGLGAGPEPVRRVDLTVERLAHAISRAVEEEPLTAGARRLASLIAGEDGTARAVEAFERACAAADGT